ncbi:RodZ domain-containing protein [Agaribacter flavus]|uniref:RodZ domain-containing protein n=1 Tax=Agaribacter flavus TaxID=1902781 RepID=A0ABV7FLD7_9ALTE
MNKQENTPEQETESQVSQSPGQQLRLARESLGLSRQQVADRLHLRLISIEAIESDGIEQGVSITFTKGYVRLYAKLVNLEVQPLLDAFERIHVGDKKPAKLQSFSRRVEREAHDSRWNMVTYVVVILVIASLGYWWYDQQEGTFSEIASDALEQVGQTFEKSEEPLEDKNEEKLDSGPQITEESVQELQNESLSNEESDSEDIRTVDVEEADDSALLDGTSELSTVTESTELAASDQIIDQETSKPIDEPDEVQDDLIASASVEEPQRNSTSLANDDGTVDMIFTFKQDCWLSVKDSTGETIAYGTKVKGRVMEISGIPPIKVNLCPPERVEIEFGRQLVDLSEFTRGSPVKIELPLASQ